MSPRNGASGTSSRRDERRSPEAKAWRGLYGLKAWRILRAAQLAAHPFCQRPIHGVRLVQATVANHRVPHRGDHDLFFDQANLESLCSDCHDGPTQQAERRGFAVAVDPSGYPSDPNHPANRGA